MRRKDFFRSSNAINLNANRIRMDLRILLNQGRLREAVHILQSTINSLRPSTYAHLLRLCTRNKALLEGKQVHHHMNQTEFRPDTILNNTLLNMYTKCSILEDARKVFDEMPQRDVCSWTVMIAAYSKHGLAAETLEFFRRMQRTGIKANQFTYASVIPACATLGDLHQGIEIHGHVIKSGFQVDVFVHSGLVDSYAKRGRIDLARQVFDEMPNPCLHSWTAMVSAYSKHGLGEKALLLFRHMHLKGVQPNHFTFASVLPACAQLGALEGGVEIHGCIIRKGFYSDLFVQSGLIDMYTKCGSLERAQNVFDRMQQRGVVSWNSLIAGYSQNGYVAKAYDLFAKMPERDIVSWNVMISGYVQCGHLDEAVKLFWEMPERGIVAWNAMVMGYARNGFVEKAFDMFQMMPQHDEVSWNVMISAYAQNGYGEEAYKLFEKMSNPGVVTWTALISGYAQNGQSVEALNLFTRMQLASVQPDSKTFACVLSACANLVAFEQGVSVHGVVIRSGFQSVVLVENALIDMYAKCGCLDKARSFFDKMLERNLVSWNVIISGYALNGCGKEALGLFEQMQQSRISPSDVTFISVLCACCHSGLVDEGQRYFDSMTRYYHIKPTTEHYIFMVDLLGRAGLLDKAEDFINKMPIQPDASVWRSLLGACRVHNNVEIGEHVAERLFEMDPRNAANYVVMSSIYLSAGRWKDAENVRRMMKERGIQKMPGCSWIEVKQQVHLFNVGDESPTQTSTIYETLGTVNARKGDMVFA